jgi:hypothetical protein
VELKTRNTIAGAVARSILNAEIDPIYSFSEGAAYKAALDRQGARLDRVFAELERDSVMMVAGVRYGKNGAP